MLYLEHIIDKNIKTIERCLVVPESINDNCSVQRVLLGFKQYRAQLCGRPLATKQIIQPTPLIRFTSCIDPRTPPHVLFSFRTRELKADSYAGNIFSPYDPEQAIAHPAHVATHLYLTWAADPQRARTFSRTQNPIRPIWFIMAHTDCGAAKKFASYPRTWGDLALDKAMRAEIDFRRALVRQYNRSPLHNQYPLEDKAYSVNPDYAALELARLMSVRAMCSISYHTQSMLDKDPSIGHRNPAFEYPLVVTLLYTTDTNKISLLDPRRECGLSPLLPVDQRVHSRDVRHAPAPK